MNAIVAQPSVATKNQLAEKRHLDKLAKKIETPKRRRTDTASLSEQLGTIVEMAQADGQVLVKKYVAPPHPSKGLVCFVTPYRREPGVPINFRGMWIEGLDERGIPRNRIMVSDRRSPPWFALLADEMADNPTEFGGLRLKVRVTGAHAENIAFVQPVAGSRAQALKEAHDDATRSVKFRNLEEALTSADRFESFLLDMICSIRNKIYTRNQPWSFVTRARNGAARPPFLIDDRGYALQMHGAHELYNSWKVMALSTRSVNDLLVEAMAALNDDNKARSWPFDLSVRGTLLVEFENTFNLPALFWVELLKLVTFTNVTTTTIKSR